MPPVSAGDWILEWLFDAGPGVSTMGGMAPLGYVEIDAYARATGIQISGDEARMLRRLSRRYTAKYAEASDPKCMAPYWDGTISDAHRTAVAEQMKRWGG